MGIFKTIKRMLGLDGNKCSEKKMEKETSVTSRDLHARILMLGPSTSRKRSFSEFREMYTDWAINNNKAAHKQLSYR